MGRQKSEESERVPANGQLLAVSIYADTPERPEMKHRETKPVRFNRDVTEH